MERFDFKKFIEIIKQLPSLMGSSNESLLNEFFLSLAMTQIYYRQNSANTREWTSASSTSKILNHERNIPKDIKRCAGSIEAKSEDFKKIEKSIAEKFLKQGVSENKKKKLIQEIIAKIESDNDISDSDKKTFRESAEKKTPANFLTRVLLYLLSHDPKPHDKAPILTGNVQQRHIADKTEKTSIGVEYRQSLIENLKLIEDASEKKYQRLYPNHINLNYYNLFVIRDDEFKEDTFSISTTLDERFTSWEFRKKIDGQKLTTKWILQEYPSIFIPCVQGSNLAEQNAYIGFVDDYTNHSGIGLITWHYVAKVSLRSILLWCDFDFCHMDQDLSELDKPHWAVKKGDLFYNIKGVLPPLSLPIIPDVNALLSTVQIKYGGFSEGFSLNFTSYCYGDYGANLTEIVKALRIPAFITNRIAHQEKTEFVFDEQRIQPDWTLYDIFPNISHLTKLLEQMEDKYIPEIKVTPVVLGRKFTWRNCRLDEKEGEIIALPISVQNEADDIERSIGELIEAILYWAKKE